LIYETQRKNKPLLSLLMPAASIMLALSFVMFGFAAPANDGTSLISNKDYISFMSLSFGYLITCRAYLAVGDHLSRVRSEVGSA